MRNEELVSGVRTGNSRYLVTAEKEGYTIRPVFGPPGMVLHYKPRSKFDPLPFTDDYFRYNSTECWADPPRNLPSTQDS